MTTVSAPTGFSPNVTNTLAKAMPPSETAKAILAETQIGKSTHHINKIEAHLDALAAQDPKTANAVRAEVMKRLSATEQGELSRVRVGDMRVTAEGQSFNHAPKGPNLPSQEDWLAMAKAAGDPRYYGYVTIAKSENLDALKKAMDDVYNSVVSLPLGDNGSTVGDALDWVGNQVSGIDREAIMNGVRTVVCPIPAIGPNAGLSGYAILGGGVNGGVQFDPKTGQITIGGGVEVGFGVGAKMSIKNAQLNKNESVQGGYGGSDGFGGGVGVVTGTQVGIASASAQYKIAGSASKNDPSFKGRTSAQASLGGSVGANANLALTGYGSYTTPTLYDLGCKK